MSEQGPPYDSRWIQEILPHRYPLLLVDRVLELEPQKRIVCSKSVSINEEFFQGHFPGYPVMPGVLIVEALAQTAGILFLFDKENRNQHLVYFTGIERARFRKPVVPGDQLRLEVDVLRLRSHTARFQGRALVDDQLAVEAVCNSMMVDREQ